MPRRKKVECPVCQQKFDTPRGVAMHKWQMHPNGAPPITAQAQAQSNSLADKAIRLIQSIRWVVRDSGGKEEAKQLIDLV